MADKVSAQSYAHYETLEEFEAARKDILEFSTRARGHGTSVYTISRPYDDKGNLVHIYILNECGMEEDADPYYDYNSYSFKMPMRVRELCIYSCRRIDSAIFKYMHFIGDADFYGGCDEFRFVDCIWDDKEVSVYHRSHVRIAMECTGNSGGYGMFRTFPGHHIERSTSVLYERHGGNSKDEQCACPHCRDRF